MADMILQVVVSPFLEALFDNLVSLIHKEVGLLWGVDKEMRKLSSTLSTIRDILEDAEEKQAMNKAIGNWLLKLKDAVYDADDVIDEWAMEAMRLQSGIRRHGTCAKQFAPLSFLWFEQIKFSHKIMKKICVVVKKFDEIASERSRFHLKDGGVDRKLEFSQNRETSSILTEPQIYGRDEEKEHIVGMVLDNIKNQGDISIYSILGIGGLGKTTVAQLVYNDERLKEQFEVRSWVCVSENFDLKRLTRAVIVSISGEACVLEELDHLQRCLQEKLAGKRFLLVLDDVWNENQEVWNKFKGSLSCGVKGCSIIVTTRLETVASIMGTFRPYFLKFLSEDDCWSLFKQNAFGMGNEENPNLMRIGKSIVKKCGGVPLVAKVLGGLMRFKVEENEWLFVRDNEVWDLPRSDENTILPALRLSYTHLSPDLRQCVAYCSIFPKDYRMQKEEVVHLWMANGLLPSKETMQLEDVGSEIFNALLWRSFFHNPQKDEEGNIVSCMMHDLVHDLICSITVNECSIMECSQKPNLPKRTRHLSVTSSKTWSASTVQTIHHSSTSLRTLIFFVETGIKWHVHVNLPAYKSLRAMSLESMDITTLPDSIGKLKHLRYLNLSSTKILSLPESICGLKNLQTLKLEKCYYLQMLPKDIGNIISLRHLAIRRCNRITQMPVGIGQLTCLQTLSIFIVGTDNGRRIKELQGLDHLKGELILKDLEHLRCSRDGKEANLIRKQNLSSLCLRWSNSYSEEENDTDVIEGLQPHRNIKMLHIEGYRGQTLPKWLTFSSLPKLVKISLSKCRKCEDLPLLGRLSFLKVLSMCAMDSVKVFNSEGLMNGFPLLEELEFDDMPMLEEVLLLKKNGVVGLSPFPCLTRLRIKKCPMLTTITLPPSLENLLVYECNEVVIQSLKNLACLSSLKINGLNELISFSEGVLHNLNSLQYLSIWSCKKLKTLPTELGNLSTLESLVVFDCKELVSFPKELSYLPSLKSVTIDRCSQLKSLPKLGINSLISLRIIKCSSLTSLVMGLQSQTALQHLHIYRSPVDFSTVEFQDLGSLQSLVIGGFPELTSLPEGIQHLGMLQSLQVWGFASLISLPDWIGSLTKLRYLAICYCKSLSSLTEGLGDLHSLQILWVEGCHPDLHRRCEKEKGQDWHKISHIPNLRMSQNSEEEKEKDS